MRIESLVVEGLAPIKSTWLDSSQNNIFIGVNDSLFIAR